MVGVRRNVYKRGNPEEMAPNNSQKAPPHGEKGPHKEKKKPPHDEKNRHKKNNRPLTWKKGSSHGINPPTPHTPRIIILSIPQVHRHQSVTQR